MSHTLFYTVQSPADEARLRAGGEPWPTEPTRGSLGPGVYAWATPEEANAYVQRLEAHGARDLRIVQFRLADEVLARWRSLDVDALDDPDAWMERHSALWNEPIAPEPHDQDHVMRTTQFGIEHFFAAAVVGEIEWIPPKDEA